MWLSYKQQNNLKNLNYIMILKDKLFKIEKKKNET